jgi:hypothetical protein
MITTIKTTTPTYEEGQEEDDHIYLEEEHSFLEAAQLK